MVDLKFIQVNTTMTTDTITTMTTIIEMDTAIMMATEYIAILTDGIIIKMVERYIDYDYGYRRYRDYKADLVAEKMASTQQKRIFGKTDTITTMVDTMDVTGIPTSTTTEFIQQTSQELTTQLLVT